MESKNIVSWTPFYTEFADSLVKYQNNRKELIEKIKTVYEQIGMKLPTLEKDGNVVDIDPFTIFGLFNKGITEINRMKIIMGLAKEFGVTAELPHDFAGIPVLNNQQATFYYFIDHRGENDIDHLWDMFTSALSYAKKPSDQERKQFEKNYDICQKQKGVKWNLTMGLFWIRPHDFMNLDARTRWFMEKMEKEAIASGPLAFKNGMQFVPNGESYLELCRTYKKLMEEKRFPYESFLELSCAAWETSVEANNKKKPEEEKNSMEDSMVDSDVRPVHYWIYSPGDGACKWDEFYKAGIMAINWGSIGDLKTFSSKEEMKQKMKESFDPKLSYKNAAHATWQFANEMEIGDVIFVKKGMQTLIGKGIVTSDYYYDPNGKDGYKNVREVDWTHKEEKPHPGHAVMKALTDITIYKEYVDELLALYANEDAEEEVEKKKPSYTKEDFLNEVFLSQDKYEILTRLLRNKKNIILQGAPGVGKTYMVKRLAYSMIGEVDPERIEMVQFHQSYSYEDFVMGFRPKRDGNGFEIKHGPFYKFCKKAEIDSENEYFFIIDEINRGNVSKIFGELFMLIENDKRGYGIRLLYEDQTFSVPKNVHIIGMMNTADRSLAILDYALRRRFAFFEMLPAFKEEQFVKYQKEINNEKYDHLIDVIKHLNTEIEKDDSLGRGFCIGHSYFVTKKDEVDDGWLYSVVTYELIPLLEEYWFDDMAKLDAWKPKLYEAIR